jgi:hypothetical protein
VSAAGAAQAIAGLRALGLSLSGSYPFSFRLAEPLRRARPEWWAAFVAAAPEVAELRLAQARDYGFVSFLEQQLSAAELDELDAIVASFIAGPEAESAWGVELDNTERWYRELTERRRAS